MIGHPWPTASSSLVTHSLVRNAAVRLFRWPLCMLENLISRSLRCGLHMGVEAARTRWVHTRYRSSILRETLTPSMIKSCQTAKYFDTTVSCCHGIMFCCWIQVSLEGVRSQWLCVSSNCLIIVTCIYTMLQCWTMSLSRGTWRDSETYD